LAISRNLLLSRALLAVSAVSLLLALVVTATGGFSIVLPAGLLFRSHRAIVPAAIALAALAAAIAVAGPSAVAREVQRAGSRGQASTLAIVLALLTFSIGAIFNTRAAGGADSYGYLSQAALWTEGRLHVDQPLARKAPWPLQDWTFSPLGYRPAPAAGAIVPTYPPGYPLAVAPFLRAGGQTAAFLVVPLFGAAVIWLTFLLGRQIGGSLVGLLAAVLTSFSPIFLFQLVQPMSDVPVTAWWLAALVAATRPRLALVSGLFASAALLTRPNLLPLVAVVALVAALSRLTTDGRWAALTRAALVGLGSLPGAAALALINRSLYGSPFSTGYGQVASMFSIAYLVPNLRQYPVWLVQTHSPFIFLALAAIVSPGTSAVGFPDGASIRGRRLVWSLAVFVLLVTACYLAYFPFPEWWYLRFLLPGVPVLLALAVGGASALMSRRASHLRAPILVTLCVSLATWYVSVARSRDAFALRGFERRYLEAGRYARQHLPERAIVLAVQHSGSLRYHGGRLTLRWDYLDPAWLDRALGWLDAQGYRPYLLLDPFEEADFRKRFRGHSVYGDLDWPASAEIGGTARVRLYDPADRDRFLAGAHLVPRRFP
jgi:hypothetical protein